jgi:hypothetical protein
MRGGEQRQFDGQLNDEDSIEALVYQKNLKRSASNPAPIGAVQSPSCHAVTKEIL